MQTAILRGLAGIFIYHWMPKILPMFEMNGLWWGDLGHQIDLSAGALFFLRRNVSLKVGIAVPIDVKMPWSTRWMPWIKLAAWF